MKFGDFSRASIKNKVFTIGYPPINIMGARLKYTESVISTVTEIIDNPIVFQTTVPIQPGNSGGPLFNYKVEVMINNGILQSNLWVEFLRVATTQLNHLLLKIIIGTATEALQSNRGIVVLTTYSNSHPDFIEAILKNVVLILGKVD